MIKTSEQPKNYQGIPYGKIGIDHDLESCSEYNDLHFNLEDINEVLAVHEGERDEEHWVWVIYLRDSRYALVDGGCAFSGWDVGGSVEVQFGDNVFELVRNHVYYRPFDNVKQELLLQLQKGKNETWRETTDRALGMGDVAVLDVLSSIRSKKLVDSKEIDETEAQLKQLGNRVHELTTERNLLAWLLCDLMPDIHGLPQEVLDLMKTVHAVDFDIVVYQYNMTHIKKD